MSAIDFAITILAFVIFLIVLWSKRANPHERQRIRNQIESIFRDEKRFKTVPIRKTRVRQDAEKDRVMKNIYSQFKAEKKKRKNM